MHRGGGRRRRGTPAQGTGGAVVGRGGDGVHGGGQGEPPVPHGSGAGGNGSGGLGGAADGGRSLGIKKQAKKSRHISIPFTVEKVRMVEVKGLGQKGKFIMKRPSTISPSHCTDVFLDLDSPTSLHRLRIMRTICHPNILRLEGYVENKSEKLQGAFVEPVCGVLSSYLTSILDLASNLDIVPSQAFQHILRQTVNGLCELAANGLYHGNFKFQNTYYRIVGGDFVVKLAGFTQKGLSLEEGRRLDLNDLGDELEAILNHIRSEHKRFNFLLLEDLVRRLKSVTVEQLVNIRETLLNTVFFWDKKKRTAVFINKVPASLNDPNIRHMVIQHHACDTPWDTNPFYGLKQAMNAYRFQKFGTMYSGKNKIHHFTFVSGAYTHEEQLKDSLPNNASVDEIIQLCDLNIFLEAHRLMP